MEQINVILRRDVISKKFGITIPKDTILKATINEIDGKAEINIRHNTYMIIGSKDYVICKYDNGVEYHREPNLSEIKFGEGATHYLNIPESVCRKQNGNLKKWVIFNGERYYR